MNKSQIIEFIDDIKSGDIVVHLSHIDLDGYGSSYMVKKHLDCILVQVNANYGGITEALSDVGITSSTKVIITDLNLTLDECQELDDLTKNWIVIDHHGSGVDSFKEYGDNYYLDTDKCATLLTYEVLAGSKFKMSDTSESIAILIDTYDMWRKEKELFKTGMLASHYISSMPFESNQLKLDYTMWLFDTIIPFLLEHGVQECEMQYQRQFMFWINNTSKHEFIRDALLPTNIKCALMHIPIIEQYIIGQTEDYVIFSGLSSKVTQYAFDELFNFPDYKDLVLINLNQKKGNVAFRSINDKAQSLAMKAGGGGHPNASGCNLKPIEGETYLESLMNVLKEK